MFSTWHECSSRPRIAVVITSSPASISGQSLIALFDVMIAIPEDAWVVFHDLPPVELADVLVRLARSVSLPKLRKHPRGPKKPKPKKQSGAKIKHVATAKILKARQTCTR